MLSESLLKSFSRHDCLNNRLLFCLENIIALFKKIEEEAGDEYSAVFGKYVVLGAGTFLVRQNEILENFWFLEEGIAREFYLIDGIEKNHDFFFPLQFVDTYGASILKKPSRVNIQLLTDAKLRVINFKALAALKAQYPDLWKIEQLIAANNVFLLEERLYSIQYLSATDRYEELLKKQPYYIQKIPLTHIASYLDISTETLSRIRAKIK